MMKTRVIHAYYIKRIIHACYSRALLLAAGWSGSCEFFTDCPMVFTVLIDSLGDLIHRADDENFCDGWGTCGG